MSTDIKDKSDIKTLVDTFYHRAGEDDLLGPIFSQIADSDSHKELLYRYWEMALLSETADRREGFPEHIERMFTRQHFIRWLTFFLNTIDTLYKGEMAAKAKIIVIKKSEEFQSRLEFNRF
jgi:hemoglobin